MLDPDIRSTVQSIVQSTVQSIVQSPGFVATRCYATQLQRSRDISEALPTNSMEILQLSSDTVAIS